MQEELQAKEQLFEDNLIPLSAELIAAVRSLDVKNVSALADLITWQGEEMLKVKDLLEMMCSKVGFELKFGQLSEK